MLNSGTISASESFGGRGVYLKAGGYIGNAAGAAISGHNSGVRVAGNGVVVNYGSISSTFASRRFEAGVGLSLIGGGSVINAASGLISGDNYGVESSGGTTVLYNFGSIKNNDATDGASVYLNGGGLVTNAVAGLIAGGQYGIEVADGPGFVLNSGTIANVNAGAGAGIAAKAAASINNYDTGLITGAEYGVALMGFGIVTNSGSIAGGVAGVHSTAIGHVTNTAGASIDGGAIGVVLAVGGTVINAGSITGGEGKALAFYGTAAGRVVVDAGAVFNGNVVGSTSASNTLELASGTTTGTISGIGSSFVNFGSVLVDSDARWELTGANSLASGSTLTNGGTLSLSGATLSDAGGIINNGRIELDPSTLSVASLSGTGTVTIDTGSTLAVQGVVSAGQDIVFEGVGGELDLGTASAFSGTISGFAEGDIIDLTSVADVAGSHADMNYTTNVLTVTEGGQTFQFQFDKAGHFAGDFFHLTSLDGGTVISEDQIACYRRGTLISAERGEVPVAALAIGASVLTASGALRPIKWIGRRSYGGRFILGRKDILPICLRAGSLADGVPRRDLWISPHHAMLLDGVLIEAKDLINGVSIVQAADVEEVEYFHVELDSHDVILAEGAPSETFVDDDSRLMFHNAQEYAALYPDEARRAVHYCAPRFDIGHELEAIRKRLAQRAGLAGGQAAESGALRGFIDAVSERAVEGWAQNIEHPEAPVCLDIFAVGRLIGQTLANLCREDLRAAGLGSGRHAFAFRPNEGLAQSPVGIEVRRSFDGAVLKGRR